MSEPEILRSPFSPGAQDPLLTQAAPGVLHFGGARMALLDIEAGFWSIREQIEALIGLRLTHQVLQQAGANGGASFARSFFAEQTGERSAAFQACLQAYTAAGFGKFEIGRLEWPLGHILVRASDTFEAWMTRRHGPASKEPVCAYTAGVLVGFINVISERQDVVCIERCCQAQGAEACEFELLPASRAGEQEQVVSYNPEPGMSRQINLLEMLFERMPMGIAIIDRDFILRRCNPTWAAFIEQYTPSQSKDVLPGACIFDLEPGTEEVLIPLFNRVFNGETVRVEPVRIESGGIDSYWDIVLSPLYENGQIVGLLDVSIDATERVRAEQQLKETLARLEERVEERTQEVEHRRKIAESLRDILGMLNSDLPLDVIMEKAVQLAMPRLGASACTLHHFDLENQLVTHVASYGMPTEYKKGTTLPFADMKPLGGADYLEASLRQQPTFGNYSPLPERIEEIERDASIPVEIKAQRIALRTRFAGALTVPLVIQGVVYGGMVFYYSTPQAFSDEQVQLAVTFAIQAALAIENARLRQQAADMAVLSERNRLARDLHDAVTQTLFSATLIGEVLPKLWERNPPAAKQKLEELRLLTRGALSEMRTLLLELRPASLVELDLGTLLRHLANAFTGRTRIPASLALDGEFDPAPEIKEVFYRVAQEALSNTSKHAEASKVTIHLKRQKTRVEMHIRDDGRGFDPQSISPENLGLSIMRERAKTIQAQLALESRMGAGTNIELVWEEGPE